MWIEETNPVKLHKEFDAKLTAAGFNVLSHTEHHFQPQGWTALYLLSESHFAIHTFPENNKSYIELSSCVEEPFRKFIALM